MTKKTKNGFTLIELLVVIAVIALLLSIIVPSLRLVRQKAASAVCLTNSKNLALAWYMYKEDSNGLIMSSLMNGTEPSGLRVGWIGRPYKNTPGDCSITQVSPEVTDDDEIRGIRNGRLHDYLESPETYHCPGDRLRKSKYDGSSIFVSYSIPSALYGHTDPGHKLYNRQIRRYSEITSPGTRYVFVESAEERNWNENGRFVLGSPEVTGGLWAWWGPMAVNHGDSSVLAYADGHAETRRWQDPFTKERITKLSRLDVPTYDIELPPEGQTEDIGFMARGWPYRGG